MEHCTQSRTHATMHTLDSLFELSTVHVADNQLLVRIHAGKNCNFRPNHNSMKTILKQYLNRMQNSIPKITKFNNSNETDSFRSSHANSAAKKDQRSVDRHAPQCDDETGCGRRMGADKIARHMLVRREEVSRMQHRRRHGDTQSYTIARHGGQSAAGSRRAGERRGWK